jgi:uncharacterized protein YkwD
MSCCGGNPIEGDELHGYTVEQLVKDKKKRKEFSDKVFKVFDNKKPKGLLDKREMQGAALHTLNCFKHSHAVSLSDKEFNKIWKETDEDGNGTVDKEEFFHFMTRVIQKSLKDAKTHKKGKKDKKDKKDKKAKKESSSGSASAAASASGAASGSASEEEEEELAEFSEQEETESSGSGSGAGGELGEFIAHHNKLRKQHGVPALTHDPALDKSALAWAKQMCKDEKMYHSTAMANNVSENLFCGTGKEYTPKEATQAWYDEISMYDYENPGFNAATGHFTALIWKDVKKIGYAKMKSKKGQLFIVGHYSPAGNMLGEFEDNVLAPL